MSRTGRSGSLTNNGQENDNTVTGAYSRDVTSSDSYTLTENGQAAGGSYTETVQGSETNSLSESGNTPDQTFSRTVSGNGSYTVTDSGPGATLPNGDGSYAYSVQESGDWKSGSLSQSETGTDRYVALQNFTNVSNATQGTPGNLDYSPFGLPFSDAPPGLSREISPRDAQLPAGLGFALVFWNLLLVLQYSYDRLPQLAGLGPKDLATSAWRFLESEPMTCMLLAEVLALLGLLLAWGQETPSAYDSVNTGNLTISPPFNAD